MTGTIGYATEQGLGIQTRSFIEHGIIDKILIQPHSTYENHYEWYSDEQKVHSIQELLDTCDKLIFFETLWDKWKIIPLARERGIKTIFVVHYECTGPFPYYPDVVVAPSDIDKEIFPEAIRLNIPVDMQWKERTRALTFVHNAGHGGLGGRNGTKELLEAMQYVKSPIRLIMRHQNGGLVSNDPRVTIVNGSVPYEDLWKEGDVFVLPEKFGGSFLPMQEAFASGMAVMASERETNKWLPNELLIPVSGYRKERIAREFDSAIIDPKDIARKIDDIYNKDISKYSLMGKVWGEENNWENLKQHYEAL
jgi:hypothetical protein